MTDPIEQITGWKKLGERHYQQPAEQRAEALERELKAAVETAGFMERYHIEAAASRARRLTHALLRTAVESHPDEAALIADAAFDFALRHLSEQPLEILQRRVADYYHDNK